MGRRGAGAGGIVKRLMDPVARAGIEAAAARRELLQRLGKRAGRGQRRQAPLLNKMLAENASALVVDELRHILSAAKRAAKQGSAAARSTSRTRTSSASRGGGMLAPEDVDWVLRDVAVTAAIFAQRNEASGGLDAKQQAKVDALLAQISRLVGEEHLRHMRQMFRAGATRSGVNRNIRSMLGAAGVAQLFAALRSSATSLSAASGSGSLLSGATLSARSGSAKNRAARRGVLRRRRAQGSRSGDTRSAGTDTRSAIRSGSGSLRSARTGTRTSSRAWDSAMSARFRAMQKAGSPERIVLRAAGRRVVSPERFMAGAVAISRLQELAAGAISLRRKIAAAKARGEVEALRQDLAGLKREYVMELLQTTPKRLDKDERRMLVKQLDAVFATKGSADRAKAAAKAELAELIALKLAHPDVAGLSGASARSVMSRRRLLGQLVYDRVAVLLGRREMSVLEDENRSATTSARGSSGVGTVSRSRSRRSAASRTASRARSATTASRSKAGSGYLRWSSIRSLRRPAARSI